MILPEAEYRRIYRSMPIACVDLLITDPAGRVLLVRRRNEPAAGRWWFPGGRVHHGETRRDAALRKLHEETGLAGGDPEELLTADLIFAEPVEAARHGITTVFRIRVTGAAAPRLDAQSSEADWRAPDAWRREPLHAFVDGVLARSA